MELDFLARGIIVTILVGFMLEVFTNIFGVFPWAIAVVTATNTAAKEASSYNTFFDETKKGLETQLTNLPASVDVGSVSSWLPKKESEIRANGVDNKVITLAKSHELAGSKVVMVEGNGHMGVSYKTSVESQNMDQQAIETSMDKTKIGDYLEPIDIYTFAVYPLEIGHGALFSRTYLVPWVYHAGSIGLHLYR